MFGHITRFMRKIMTDINKREDRLFRAYYYPRSINDRKLRAQIRASAFPGHNIFLLGRTGEGKTCFLRNYRLNNPTFDVGFSESKKKDIYYMPIEFDGPGWRTDATDDELLEQIVNGIEGYLRKYDLFPREYDQTKSMNHKYRLAVSALNELGFDNKAGQLVVLIDDIDHAPVDFQIKFLDAIYSLLRSTGCVCIYAVRPPAYSTALTRTSGKLATAFVDFNTVELRPIAIRNLANHRAKATLGWDELLKTLEEPDFSLKGFVYEYLLPETLDNFVQQYCCGDIRSMTKLMIRFTEKFEGLRAGGKPLEIGRTKTLELMHNQLIDVFADKNKKGFSLTFSVLEMLRVQSRVDDAFYSVMSSTGFGQDEVKRCLEILYEADAIEQSLIFDSYARMRDAGIEIVSEYVLTQKANWLMAMAQWPQYRKVFVPPKRTLTEGGEIFDRRVFAELIEFIRDMLIACNHKKPVIKLKWQMCFSVFHKCVAQPLPPKKGAPGRTGFGENQLYRITEKQGLLDKNQCKYPKIVAINRVAFDNACKLCGLSVDESNPFADTEMIAIAAKDIVEME